jgi:hypothetical protein
MIGIKGKTTFNKGYIKKGSLINICQITFKIDSVLI